MPFPAAAFEEALAEPPAEDFQRSSKPPRPPELAVEAAADGLDDAEGTEAVEDWRWTCCGANGAPKEAVGETAADGLMDAARGGAAAADAGAESPKKSNTLEAPLLAAPLEGAEARETVGLGAVAGVGAEGAAWKSSKSSSKTLALLRAGAAAGANAGAAAAGAGSSSSKSKRLTSFFGAGLGTVVVDARLPEPEAEGAARRVLDVGERASS